MSLSLFSEPAIHRFGWLLVHSLWQFTLIAFAVVILLRLLHRSSPNLRYALSLAGMLCLAAAPVVTYMCLPAQSSESEMPATQTTVTLPQTDLPVTTGVPAVTSTAPPAETIPTAASASSTMTSSDMPAPSVAAAPTARNWHRDLEAAASRWLDELVAFWCLGVLLFSLRPLWSWIQLRRLCRTGVSPVPRSVQTALEDAARRLRIRRPVRIMQSSLATVPMVVGYLRPLVLVPLSVVSGLSPAQLEGLLAHELAHVRRHDFLVNLLQTLLETIFFYHPGVWWISSRVRREREFCCDELAAGLLGNRTEYARTLLALEELRGTSPLLSLGANSGSLLNRIRRLTASQPAPRPRGGIIAFATLAAVAFLTAAWLWDTTSPALADDQPADDDAQLQAALAKVDHDDPHMVEIIRAVIEQEHRYRHLEYVLRRESYFREDQPSGAGSSSEVSVEFDETDDPPPMETEPRIVETSRVILDGDRYSFQQDRESRTKQGLEQLHQRESAFDGERTVSVEHDNSANIHLSRYEPSQMLAPHVWAMQQLLANLPLSVYLQGGEVLESHPKRRRSPRPFGGGYELLATKSEYLGTELVGGLQCHKVRVYQTYRPDSEPMVNDLWLARDRNLLCIKSQRLLKIGDEERVWIVTTADNLREVEQGLWLPAEVNSTQFDHRSLSEGERLPRTTVGMTLHDVSVGGTYRDEQFKVEIPGDVPLFTIGSDGLVDSPHHPQPAPERSQTTADEIIQAVQGREALYEDIDITQEKEYLHLNSIYHAATGSGGTPWYKRRTRMAVVASKKYWLREVSNRYQDGTSSTEREFSVGKRADRSPFPPHSCLLVSTGKLLSSHLRGGPDHRLAYEGDDLIDGLLCHRLRRDRLSSNGSASHRSYLWICPERSYLPLRVENFHYARSRTLPTGVHTVEELQEITPGVWFPIRWTKLACHAMDGRGLMENRMIVNWRENHQVLSVTLDPEVDLTDPEFDLPAPDPAPRPLPEPRNPPLEFF